MTKPFKISDLEKRNPFKVPENYLEDFTENFMARLPEEHKLPSPRRLSLWNRIVPYLSTAAVIALVFTATRSFHESFHTEFNKGYTENTGLTSKAETTESDAAYDYLMIDALSLYDLAGSTTE